MHVPYAVSRVIDVRANQWIRDIAKLERACPSRQCLAVKDVHLSKARLTTIMLTFMLTHEFLCTIPLPPSLPGAMTDGRFPLPALSRSERT